MRLAVLALAAIFVAGAKPVPAQSVIDVEGQKAAAPQVQDQGEPRSADRAPALPQASPPAQGRFSFTPVENGFLRLDSDSGQTAFCSSQTVGWACQPVPEVRATLETKITQLQDEIASLKKFETEMGRLRDEIASLKKEIVALKEPPAPRPPADLTPPTDKNRNVTVKLPTHEDLVRARDFIEETWRRLVEMIATMQKDVIRKG